MPYVLVVDDDIDTRSVIVLALQDSGHKTVGAANGLEALLLITDPKRPTRPYLILLDLYMPIMSGFQFLQITNCCDHLSEIPITIITGVSTGMPPGYDLLMKPIELEKLLSLAAERKKAAKPGPIPRR